MERNHKFWIIKDVSETTLRVDPFEHIHDMIRWLIDNLGEPVYGFNIVSRKNGVWEITTHCMKKCKIHYCISFQNLEDATLFRMVWL